MKNEDDSSFRAQRNLATPSRATDERPLPVALFAHIPASIASPLSFRAAVWPRRQRAIPNASRPAARQCRKAHCREPAVAAARLRHMCYPSSSSGAFLMYNTLLHLHVRIRRDTSAIAASPAFAARAAWLPKALRDSATPKRPTRFWQAQFTMHLPPQRKHVLYIVSSRRRRHRDALRHRHANVAAQPCRNATKTAVPKRTG